MSKKDRAAHLAPNRRPQSLQEVQDDLNRILGERFRLDPLPQFSVFLEGWTDVLYLKRAAELAAEHLDEDLLTAIDDDGTQTRIALLTVGNPTDPSRGGADRLVKLAEEIYSYVFRIRMFSVFFVFDHDATGINACNGVCDLGFIFNSQTTTLNPDKPMEPKNFSIKHERLVEDLLSLRIQQQFFDGCANRCCKVTYHNGAVTRFQWEGVSKTELQDFACTRGSLEDLLEFVYLLRRIRKAFALPSLQAIQPRTEQDILDVEFDASQ
jgi:hypothetical protein